MTRYQLSLAYRLVRDFSTLLALLCVSAAWALVAAATPDTPPESYMSQGAQAFEHGDFGQAISRWQQAARLYKQHKQFSAQSKALTNMAAAYQALGQYKKAVAGLQTALELAKQVDDQAQTAAVLASLGNVYIALGPAETASQYLRTALALAKALNNVGFTASILNNLGNLLTSQQQKPQDGREAYEAYKESVTFARAAGQPALLVTALANTAMAAIRLGQYYESRALLDEAWEQRQALKPTQDAAYGLSKIGLGYEALRQYLVELHDTLLLRAAEGFNAAAHMAQTIGDQRAASYAWGYLGHLYETQGRYEEALYLTRQAVAAAQQVHAPESLYRWHWQTGRLLNAQHNDTAAIAAYRRAIATLQAIRPELLTSYGKPRTTFRESTGQLYFEFVDLLLQRAAVLQDPQLYTLNLQEARETVELFKAAELRDYFRDECVDAALSRTVALDRFSQAAVIIYPILLQQRTELLVSFPQGLKRFAVPVEAEELGRVVRRFRVALQEGAEQRYMLHAQRLYDWLIRPLEPDLATLTISTLVFVPDGPLRLIPMAALHDGQTFLIDRYALATTPGLDLTDPQPLTRVGIQVLAVGVTEPVQGFTALPHAAEELTTVQRLYGGTVLLNHDFLLSRMEKALQKENFGIVHIASHGQFASEAKQSFVLTFDDKLTMDRLGEFVGRLRFRAEPLELLTLSACETAVGDDRAALGLAGIAIKAGARSALATLWQVEDEAAAMLVREFYRQLKDPAVSRAVALQRAQLALLKHERYQSPVYWAPFLLLNNWF
jgi:CHAT domain-containing protein